MLVGSFFSLGSLSHISSAEVQHDSGDDDGEDTRNGTWELTEEL